MEFHTLRTQYQWSKSFKETDAKSHAEYARRAIGFLENMSYEKFGKPLSEIDPFTPVGLLAEADWAEQRMPYYNLWPNIISALTKLKLDVETQFFRLPVSPLLVRFPSKVPHPLTWSYDGKEWSIQTMLVCEGGLRPSPGFVKQHNIPPNGEVPALSFWLDIGETIDPETPQYRRKLYKHLLKVPGWTIERSFEEIPSHDSASEGVVYPDEIVENCARVACTLCLMAADPELVVPDVLSADKSKFAETHDLRLVEKAHRRGKVGWDVGASIEVSPHYRNACPAALYWTGEGRKIPRIRFRKGGFVHRQRLSEVPTGYLLPQGDAT